MTCQFLIVLATTVAPKLSDATSKYCNGCFTFTPEAAPQYAGCSTDCPDKLYYENAVFTSKGCGTQKLAITPERLSCMSSVTSFTADYVQLGPFILKGQCMAARTLLPLVTPALLYTVPLLMVCVAQCPIQLPAVLVTAAELTCAAASQTTFSAGLQLFMNGCAHGTTVDVYAAEATCTSYTTAATCPSGTVQVGADCVKICPFRTVGDFCADVTCDAAPSHVSTGGVASDLVMNIGAVCTAISPASCTQTVIYGDEITCGPCTGYAINVAAGADIVVGCFTQKPDTCLYYKKITGYIQCYKTAAEVPADCTHTSTDNECLAACGTRYAFEPAACLSTNVGTGTGCLCYNQCADHGKKFDGTKCVSACANVSITNNTVCNQTCYYNNLSVPTDPWKNNLEVVVNGVSYCIDCPVGKVAQFQQDLGYPVCVSNSALRKHQLGHFYSDLSCGGISQAMQDGNYTKYNKDENLVCVESCLKYLLTVAGGSGAEYYCTDCTQFGYFRDDSAKTCSQTRPAGCTYARKVGDIYVCATNCAIGEFESSFFCDKQCPTGKIFISNTTIGAIYYYKCSAAITTSLYQYVTLATIEYKLCISTCLTYLATNDKTLCLPSCSALIISGVTTQYCSTCISGSILQYTITGETFTCTIMTSADYCLTGKKFGTQLCIITTVATPETCQALAGKLSQFQSFIYKDSSNICVSRCSNYLMMGQVGGIWTDSLQCTDCKGATNSRNYDLNGGVPQCYPLAIPTYNENTCKKYLQVPGEGSQCYPSCNGMYSVMNLFTPTAECKLTCTRYESGMCQEGIKCTLNYEYTDADAKVICSNTCPSTHFINTQAADNTCVSVCPGGTTQFTIDGVKYCSACAAVKFSAATGVRVPVCQAGACAVEIYKYVVSGVTFCVNIMCKDSAAFLGANKQIYIDSADSKLCTTCPTELFYAVTSAGPQCLADCNNKLVYPAVDPQGRKLCSAVADPAVCPYCNPDIGNPLECVCAVTCGDGFYQVQAGSGFEHCLTTCKFYKLNGTRKICVSPTSTPLASSDCPFFYVNDTSYLCATTCAIYALNEATFLYPNRTCSTQCTYSTFISSTEGNKTFCINATCSGTNLFLVSSLSCITGIAADNCAPNFGYQGLRLCSPINCKNAGSLGLQPMSITNDVHNTCVSSCLSINQLIDVNGKCLTTCAPGDYQHLKDSSIDSGDSQLCQDVRIIQLCPFYDTIGGINTCYPNSTAECQGTLRIYGNTCIAQCPWNAAPDQFYMETDSNGVMKCVRGCPIYFTVDISGENRCINTCKFIDGVHLLLGQKQCQTYNAVGGDFLVAFTDFKTKVTCTGSTDFFDFDLSSQTFECVSICSKTLYVATSGEKLCSTMTCAAFITKFGGAKTNLNPTLTGFECVQYCTATYFMLGTTSCTPCTAPGLYRGNIVDANGVKTCSDSLDPLYCDAYNADTTTFAYQCATSCSVMLSVDGTALKPSPAPNTKRCVSVCPILDLAGTACVSSCLPDENVNGRCTLLSARKYCPSGQAYSQLTQLCIPKASCPSKMAVNVYGVLYCYDNVGGCASPNYIYFNELLDILSCEAACPTGTKTIESLNVGQFCLNINSCAEARNLIPEVGVNAAPTLSNAGKCVDSCTGVKINIGEECVTCPQTVGSLPECYNTCLPYGFFVDSSTTCIESCSNYQFGFRCYTLPTSCPTKYYISTASGKFCTDTCAGYIVPKAAKSIHQCVDICSGIQYNYNNIRYCVTLADTEQVVLDINNPEKSDIIPNDNCITTPGAFSIDLGAPSKLFCMLLTCSNAAIIFSHNLLLKQYTFTDGSSCTNSCPATRLLHTISGTEKTCQAACLAKQYQHLNGLCSFIQILQYCPTTTDAQPYVCSKCGNELISPFAHQQYLLTVPTGQSCIVSCPTTHFLDVSGEVCIPQCLNGQYWTSGAQNVCTAYCISFIIIQSTNYETIYQCSLICASAPGSMPFTVNGQSFCNQCNSATHYLLFDEISLTYKCVDRNITCQYYLMTDSKTNTICINEICTQSTVIISKSLAFLRDGTCITACTSSEYIQSDYLGIVNCKSCSNIGDYKYSITTTDYCEQIQNVQKCPKRLVAQQSDPITEAIQCATSCTGLYLNLTLTDLCVLNCPSTMYMNFAYDTCISVCDTKYFVYELYNGYLQKHCTDEYNVVIDTQVIMTNDSRQIILKTQCSSLIFQIAPNDGRWFCSSCTSSQYLKYTKSSHSFQCLSNNTICDFTKIGSNSVSSWICWENACKDSSQLFKNAVFKTLLFDVHSTCAVACSGDVSFAGPNNICTDCSGNRQFRNTDKTCTTDFIKTICPFVTNSLGYGFDGNCTFCSSSTQAVETTESGSVQCDPGCIGTCKLCYFCKSTLTAVSQAPMCTGAFTCKTTCPTGTYIYNGTLCVKTCPDGYFYNGLQCVENCPFYYENKICYDTYQAGKFVSSSNGKQLQAVCYTNNITYNGILFCSSCTAVQVLIFSTTPQYAMQCSDVCPSGTFLHGGFACLADACPKPTDFVAMQLYFPQVASMWHEYYQDGSVCRTICTSLKYQIISGNYICTDCSAQNLYIFTSGNNGQLECGMSECALYIYNMTGPQVCVSSCPSRRMYNTKYCISMCGLDQYVSNNFCVDFCPVGQMWMIQSNEKVCVAQQGSYYRHSVTNELTTECFQKRSFTFNGFKFCNECPVEMLLDFDKATYYSVCITIASCTKVQIGGICIDSTCSEAITYFTDDIYNKNLIYYDYGTKICVLSCMRSQGVAPMLFSRFLIDSSGKKCYQNANNYLQIPVTSTQQWVDTVTPSRCPFFVTQTTFKQCVSTCPADKPFVAPGTIECVAVCLTYVRDGVCVASCGSSYIWTFNGADNCVDNEIIFGQPPLYIDTVTQKLIATCGSVANPKTAFNFNGKRYCQGCPFYVVVNNGALSCASTCPYLKRGWLCSAQACTDNPSIFAGVGLQYTVQMDALVFRNGQSCVNKCLGQKYDDSKICGQCGPAGGYVYAADSDTNIQCSATRTLSCTKFTYDAVSGMNLCGTTCAPTLLIRSDGACVQKCDNFVSGADSVTCVDACTAEYKDLTINDNINLHKQCIVGAAIYLEATNQKHALSSCSTSNIINAGSASKKYCNTCPVLLQVDDLVSAKFRCVDTCSLNKIGSFCTTSLCSQAPTLFSDDLTLKTLVYEQTKICVASCTTYRVSKIDNQLHCTTCTAQDFSFTSSGKTYCDVFPDATTYPTVTCIVWQQTVNGQICKATCGPSLMLIEATTLCVSSCPVGLFADNPSKTCVRNCANPYYKIESVLGTVQPSCQLACLLPLLIQLGTNNQWQCVTACPIMYDPVNNECLSQCPVGATSFILAKQLYCSRCLLSQFLDTTTIPMTCKATGAACTGKLTSGFCITGPCSANTAIFTNHLITNVYTSYDGKSCITQCTSGKFSNEQLICVDCTANGNYRLGNACITTGTQPSLCLYTQAATASPTGTFYSCKSSCFIYSGKTCAITLPDDSFILNNEITTIDKCTSFKFLTINFFGINKQIKNCITCTDYVVYPVLTRPATNPKQCVKFCQQWFINNGIQYCSPCLQWEMLSISTSSCLSSSASDCLALGSLLKGDWLCSPTACTDAALTFPGSSLQYMVYDSNGACSVCPETMYYNPSSKSCILACATTTYYVNRTCAASCATFKSVNGLCTTELVYNNCPYYNTSSKTCQLSCPVLAENGFCVTACTVKPFVNDKICVSDCPMAMYQLVGGQKQCVSICSGYQVYSTDITKQCVPTCVMKIWVSQQWWCALSCDGCANNLKTCSGAIYGTECITEALCTQLPGTVVASVCVPDSVKCGVDEVIVSGKCEKLLAQIYLRMPNGQKLGIPVLDSGKCLLIGQECVPYRCSSGLVWITAGCYDQRQCSRSNQKVDNGVCLGAILDDDWWF